MLSILRSRLFCSGRRHTNSHFHSQDGKSMNFVQYDSFFEYRFASVQIRHYSPSVSIALPKHRRFPLAKAHIPSNTSDPILLHTLLFYPIPGDHWGHGYDSSLPDYIAPLTFLIGHSIRLWVLPPPNQKQWILIVRRTSLPRPCIPPSLACFLIKKFYLVVFPPSKPHIWESYLVKA